MTGLSRGAHSQIMWPPPPPPPPPGGLASVGWVLKAMSRASVMRPRKRASPILFSRRMGPPQRLIDSAAAVGHAVRATEAPGDTGVGIDLPSVTDHGRIEVRALAEASRWSRFRRSRADDDQHREHQETEKEGYADPVHPSHGSSSENEARHPTDPVRPSRMPARSSIRGPYHDTRSLEPGWFEMVM